VVETDGPAPDERTGSAPSNPSKQHGVDALLGFFRVDVLVVVVVVGVVVWVVATALYGFILGRLVHSASIGEWYRWAMVVQQWSYAAWLGALAILAARWLRERLPR
jgi:hypothetical protein